MQDTSPNRKRATPGLAPAVQQAQPQQNYAYPQMPQNPDFSNFDFSTPLPQGQPGNNIGAFDANNFAAYTQNNAQQQTFGSNPAPAPQSAELVRRSRNQPLTSQNGQQGQQEQWSDMRAVNGSPEDENEAELERRADQAMKEGLAKRKQIPPFVQKLSSFLDSNHTDLIRWTDDGRHFIVLDEDEFARTLIPELFKHSNYPSFVRQLNMYGFHKTVNITDGSLRQSEKARKGVKSPSMYWHPYFRRNQPKLLWLISKPGGKSSAKRKRDGTMKQQYDSDEERQITPAPEGRIQELDLPLDHPSDVAQLPSNELSAVRKELQKLQTQQKFISQMIVQLKEQNDQFYRQASTFQALHDRHENSINAILTFLATFYNRSLEGHGAQNLVNMFTNPNQHQNQQHGSVVEEYGDASGDQLENRQVQKYVKRQPLLLTGPVPAAAWQQHLQPGSANTEPSSARTSVSPPDDGSKRGSTSSATAAPQSATSAPTPGVKPEPQTPANEDIINLINFVNGTTQAAAPNATTAPALDFNTIVDQYQHLGGNGPLTPQQRDNTLAAIMRDQGGANSGNNNALTHPAPPNFDLSQLRDQSNTIEQLQNLQKQNQESIEQLGRRLSPHSPTGHIPGLISDLGSDPFDLTGNPGDYDPNAFLNFDADAWDGGNGGGDFDFDFNTAATGNNDSSNTNWANPFDDGAGVDDGTADMFGTSAAATNTEPATTSPEQIGGRVESVSSESTSPAQTAAGDDPGTPSKRQRTA